MGVHVCDMNPKLKAAYSFYGTAPDEASKIANISCPVYGFYGENDERVNATIPKGEELMKAAGKKYEPVIYKGAGHGFMRSGEPPIPPFAKATKSPRRSLGALEEAAQATAIAFLPFRAQPRNLIAVTTNRSAQSFHRCLL